LASTSALRFSAASIAAFTSKVLAPWLNVHKIDHPFDSDQIPNGFLSGGLFGIRHSTVPSKVIHLWIP